MIYNSRMMILACVLASGSAQADASFDEVKDVIFGENPPAQMEEEQQEQAIYDRRQLPHYSVTVQKFFGKDGTNLLRQDAKRTLQDTTDYYPRLEKRVHANGICFSGVWRITEDTPYTGYFKKDAQALFIGRASTAMTETERGRPRTFGFAGKLFPTIDPTLKVRTDNFFLIDVLAGAQRDHYQDVKMTNQPPVGFRFSALWLGFHVYSAFRSADKNPRYRPVTSIAEHGLTASEIAVAPRYLMMQAATHMPRIDDRDFRDELNIEKNNMGSLVFDILTSDTSLAKNSKDWQKIGQIELSQSKVSYGCDRRLHFPHPRAKP